MSLALIGINNNWGIHKNNNNANQKAKETEKDTLRIK